MPKISLCPHICNECGFTKDGTENTLYAEAIDVINRGVLFPCHMYLRSQTGDESRGTELLDEVKVCRGYVAYMSLYAPYPVMLRGPWAQLIDQITPEDIKNIYTPSELHFHHKGLREGVFLNNPIGSKPHGRDS